MACAVTRGHFGQHCSRSDGKDGLVSRRCHDWSRTGQQGPQPASHLQISPRTGCDLNVKLCPVPKETDTPVGQAEGRVRSVIRRESGKTQWTSLGLKLVWVTPLRT